MRNLYLITGYTDYGPLYVLAKTMGEALGKWRRWLKLQSDGAMSEIEADLAYPEGIQEVAEHESIIG